MSRRVSQAELNRLVCLTPYDMEGLWVTLSKVALTNLLADLADAEAERDALQAQLADARVPLCIGRGTIDRLSQDGQVAFEDGRGLVAADDLFHASPYDHLAAAERARDSAREEWQHLWANVAEEGSPSGALAQHLAARVAQLEQGLTKIQDDDTSPCDCDLVAKAALETMPDPTLASRLTALIAAVRILVVFEDADGHDTNPLHVKERCLICPLRDALAGLDGTPFG